MKTPKTSLTLLSILLCLQLSAQKTDTPAELPYSNKIEVSDQSLEKLFQSTEDVSVVLAPGFEIKGKIRNKTEHGNNITSLLIKVESSPGGMLSISRYRDDHGKFFYAAHLLKLHDSEGLLLVEKDNHYYFIETQQRFLVSE